MTFEDSRSYGSLSYSLEHMIAYQRDQVKLLEKLDRKLLVIIRKLENLGDTDSPDWEQKTAVKKILDQQQLPVEEV